MEFLRSLVYFLLELKSATYEGVDNRAYFEQLYASKLDPFDYAAAPGSKRFAVIASTLDAIRGESQFGSALEIGCGEGLFTKLLALRCCSLLAADISDIALERARHYCSGIEHVRFSRWDVRRDPVSERFDLVVIAGVLEYIPRAAIRKLRTKLVEALRSGGYLLVESHRANEVTENAWWGRKLIRGTWINGYVSKHEALRVVRSITTESGVITLCRKLT